MIVHPKHTVHICSTWQHHVYALNVRLLGLNIGQMRLQNTKVKGNS